MNYRLVGLLAAGHFVTDIHQGALPAMLPFLIPAYSLSYASAAGIVFAASMASTLIQPLFGHFADRVSKPWLMPLGLMLAGCGLALVGLSSGYGMILLVAAVSGVGIAAYHPEGARLVNFAAGEKKATAMSIFGVGGTLGFAVGPLLITGALLHWGLKGSLILIAPVCLMALIITAHSKRLTELAAAAGRKKAGMAFDATRDSWGAFIRLNLAAVCRSILFYGLNTFIPLYWINVLHQSKAAGGTALAILATAGVIGNLAGGRLSDRIGQRRMIVLGFVLLALSLPALLWATSVFAATLCLISIGVGLSACYSPIVVLGQRYLPNRVGLASGFTLGVTIAIGGMATPILGSIADSVGIWKTLAVLLFVPVVAAGIALTLPAPRISAKKAPARSVQTSMFSGNS
jgi:MFS transporter, FSR family, fosmidomycin resistance protein